jgi:ribonuclease Z
MKFTISGYSTALFSTWYFIEELGILMDAGDGVMTALLQKSRKIKYVFISHADRDHLTGLLQLNQLNARPGFPVICYPRDSRSFPALETFSKQFDLHVSNTVWTPVTPGERIPVKDDIVVVPVRNEHIDAPPTVIRSLGYQVMQLKQKVKPEIAALPPEQIKEIILSRGKEATTMEVTINLLSYSGDTPVADWDRYKNSDILIHEATFLDGKNSVKIASHKNKHSTLEAVMEMVSHSNIKTLILGHFSSRYTAEEIDRHILSLCDKYGISLPVYRVLPGEIVRDLLATKPVNQ